MRVLEIIADGSPGGGTTHVLQILRSLSSSWQLGLCTQRSSYLAGAARKLGIECFEIDPPSAGALFRVPLEIRRIVKEFQPELVHAHGSRAGFLAALAHCDVRIVYTVHGLHVLRRPLPVRWLGMVAERLTNMRASLTIFVSDSDRRKAVARRLVPAKHPSRVIYNGILAPESAAAPRPISGHVGFVGRMEPQKDPLLFLDVMACLPGHTAEMVGNGSLEPQVRSEIRKRGLGNVRLLGAMAHEKVQALLPKFSVVLMTSRWEGLPILALEAMAAGVPVVATNVDGVSEIIKDRVSGILVDSRSPAVIADAVRLILEDKPLRDRLITEGRRTVREEFSEERMIAEIRKVYSSFLAAPAS